MKIIDKLFGTHSERELRKIQPIADKILSLEEEYSKLTDSQLRAKTIEFKDRLAKGETLEDILVEAFATVREADWRVLGLKPYPVQVLGGIILHQGNIAEMKTGEGKTLVETMPTYLNALEGKGVYVVTVNEYLAKRDSEQMGKVYNFLGLTTGLIEHDLMEFERKDQYKCDITYCTNNEVGFDYLRDNMVSQKELKVQRGFHYAIVDEVDSILIDEARTPLIISGEGDDVSDGYKKADAFVRTLKGTIITEADKGTKLDALVNGGEILSEQEANFDFIVEEKKKTATLTERGIKKAEKYFELENLGDIENLELNHYISRALKAHNIFKRDVDYVVKDGEILIVDENTGRLMDGRRYSEGIHQAIETKEGVEIKKESKTLATITFQHFFKKFTKLAGMTGTAMTEIDEFRNIYGLDVIEIPTNKPIAREDLADIVFGTKRAKLNAIIEITKKCHEKGQPILVGTTSVESSEEISRLFKKEGIKHNVLNAKYHEQEAMIIAQAGHFGAVTIATNMAGRGTDIMLGGNVDYKVKEELRNQGYSEELIEQATAYTDTEDEEIVAIRKLYKELFAKIQEEVKPYVEKVKAAGGLFILGSERHSSRRIDNQLRGRSGRQGDAGMSQFVISLDDDLMRLFGGDKIKKMFSALNLPEDTPLDLKMLSNSIESAQKRVEGAHFDTRKRLMDYDTVLNIQREVIYQQRDEILEKATIEEGILKIFEEYIEEVVTENIAKKQGLTIEEQTNIVELLSGIPSLNSLPNYTAEQLETTKVTAIDVIKPIVEEIKLHYKELEQLSSTPYLRAYEKRYLLGLIDMCWQEHMINMDELKQGIYLRAMGQQDPLISYKTEGFRMFESMLAYIKGDLINTLMNNYVISKKAMEDRKIEAQKLVEALEKAHELNKLHFISGMKDGKPVALTDEEILKVVGIAKIEKILKEVANNKSVEAVRIQEILNEKEAV